MFAGRAAARVWPLGTRSNDWTKIHFDLALARAILSAVVRGMYINTALGEAASAASASAADYAAADYAADSAASAAAASASAASVADAAILQDLGVAGVMARDLWHDAGVSNSCAEGWEDWKAARTDRKVWGFWQDWYETLLEGRTPDWELWRDVALIDDAVWKEGPEAVAREIERLRGGGNARLDEEVIKASAERLIAHPASTMLMVGGAAEQIDNAITQFLNTSGLNSLPSSLAPLYSVSGALKSISTLAQDDQQIDALEAEIDGLVRQMNVLRSELNAIKAASPKMGRSSRMMDTALGVAVGVLVTGGIGEAGRIFSYVTGYENSVEIIEDIAQSVSEPEVIVNSLPQIGKD